MKLAILDDYQGVAHAYADWSRVPEVTVVPFRDHVFAEDELIGRLADFEIVMRIRERTEFPRRVLEKLPKLKLLLATGMRNARSIDLTAADDLGIVVSTTDALHQTTVEVTWLLILALFRDFPGETGSLRNGGWQRKVGRGLGGRTLGIMGLGNMGQPVAAIGKLMEMEVIAWSPNLTPERTAPFGVECVSKDDLFRRSDTISIHMPHSDKTEGLVGAREIGLMKPDAFLVNTARPAIVDQNALMAALSERRIGGAGLDVFDIEPLPDDHLYRRLDNVIATPHVGFVTRENYEIFFKESLENLRAFLDGQPIRTITGARPYLADSQVSRQMHAQKLKG